MLCEQVYDICCVFDSCTLIIGDALKCLVFSHLLLCRKSFILNVLYTCFLVYACFVDVYAAFSKELQNVTNHLKVSKHFESNIILQVFMGLLAFLAP